MALEFYDKQVVICNNTCKKLEEVVEEVESISDEMGVGDDGVGWRWCRVRWGRGFEVKWRVAVNSCARIAPAHTISNG